MIVYFSRCHCRNQIIMDMILLLTHILLLPSEENKWKNSNDVRTTKINQVAAVKGNIQQLQLADECQLVE